MAEQSMLEKLYNEMSELTKPECGKCRAPHSCCSREYCLESLRYAESKGVDLSRSFIDSQKVPFLIDDQCIVPPYLRPLCALHTCDINSIGFKKNDPEWTEKYFELRNKIDEEEFG